VCKELHGQQLNNFAVGGSLVRGKLSHIVTIDRNLQFLGNIVFRIEIGIDTIRAVVRHDTNVGHFTDTEAEGTIFVIS